MTRKYGHRPQPPLNGADHEPAGTVWFLSGLLPLLAGAAVWVLLNLSQRSSSCTTTAVGAVGSVALLILPSFALMWRHRRSTGSIKHYLPQILTCAAISILCVALAAWLWTGDHNCYG
ncbi:MAG: hypothetical protein M3065_08390 [Actinomycetota bacterium]|nr:hypothetical protein [Actinomycetota bacterium]